MVIISSDVMIHILVIIVIAGFILWLANFLIPMDPKFKTVLNVVAVVLLLLYILYAFGLIGGLPMRVH